MLGQRIRQARLASGLTMRELANNVGVSHTAIAKYESGRICPRPSILLKMARCLDVRMEFLFNEPCIQLSPPTCGKLAQLPRSKREAIEARIKASLEKHFELEGMLPPERQISFNEPKYTVTHLEEVEEIAEELRSEWQLGYHAISSITSALEERGIKVLVLSMLAEEVTGYACWANELIPVAVCRANLPGDLQRQILACQLAHLILDIDDELDFEEVTNRFAMAFLAPRRGLFNRVGTKRKNLDFDELCLLKQEYKLSMDALAKRTLDLGIVTRERYLGICHSFKKLSWQGQEPGDDVETEKPIRFPLLVRQAVAEGIISQVRAISFLNERETKKVDVCCEKMKQLAAAFAEEYLEDEELTAFTRLNEDFYAHE